MRSLLFVPGDSDRKIAKGFGSAADAIILDLEDAVAPGRKAEARALCAEVLGAPRNGKLVIVRINAFDTPHALDDLAAIVRGHPDGVMLPKCQGPDDVRRLADMIEILEVRDDLDGMPIDIYPIVTENARAVLSLTDYRKPMPRVAGLLWGGEDLGADIGASHNRESDGRYRPLFEAARSQCLLAATALEAAPIDAVYVDFRNPEGLRAEAEQAARDGFTAKAAIHPDQIDIINAAFTPSVEAIAHAKAVIAAFDNAESGVASLNGRMLDAPHLKGARRILDRADPKA
jgi:citrate lyase subunit beta/citryl-CoA lyase